MAATVYDIVRSLLSGIVASSRAEPELENSPSGINRETLRDSFEPANPVIQFYSPTNTEESRPAKFNYSVENSSDQGEVNDWSLSSAYERALRLAPKIISDYSTRPVGWFPDDDYSGPVATEGGVIYNEPNPDPLYLSRAVGVDEGSPGAYVFENNPRADYRAPLTIEPGPHTDEPSITPAHDPTYPGDMPTHQPPASTPAPTNPAPNGTGSVQSSSKPKTRRNIAPRTMEQALRDFNRRQAAIEAKTGTKGYSKAQRAKDMAASLALYHKRVRELMVKGASHPYIEGRANVPDDSGIDLGPSYGSDMHKKLYGY